MQMSCFTFSLSCVPHPQRLTNHFQCGCQEKHFTTLFFPPLSPVLSLLKVGRTCIQSEPVGRFMARAAPAVQSPAAAPGGDHAVLMPECLRLLSGFLSGELSFRSPRTASAAHVLTQTTCLRARLDRPQSLLHVSARIETSTFKCSRTHVSEYVSETSTGPAASQPGGQERCSV